jgi:hypothetical protein
MLPDHPGLANNVNRLNGLWPVYAGTADRYRDEVAIIVPFRARSPSHAQSLCEFYVGLSRNAPTGWAFVIADSSPIELFLQSRRSLSGSRILHLRPQPANQLDVNDKLNNVVTALRWSNSNAICLFDDDARPTFGTIKQIIANLQHVDCVRAMVHYEQPNIIDLIDIAGIFIVNMLSRRKQFWGNISFRRDAISPSFYAFHDVLFDELFIETQGLLQPCKFRYQTTPPLEMKGGGRSFGDYLEQRVRYAYEDLAQPKKAMFGFVLVPVTALVWSRFGPAGVLTCYSAIAMFCLLVGAIGSLIYTRDNRNRVAALLGPVWFLPYGITMWIALFKRLTGKGIRFGRSIIRKPA